MPRKAIRQKKERLKAMHNDIPIKESAETPRFIKDILEPIKDGQYDGIIDLKPEKHRSDYTVSASIIMMPNDKAPIKIAAELEKETEKAGGKITRICMSGTNGESIPLYVRDIKKEQNPFLNIELMMSFRNAEHEPDTPFIRKIMENGITVRRHSRQH